MHDAYKMFVGPVHPSLEEPIFFDFKIEGEKIVGVNIKPGNAHRGIEALGMQRNPVKVLTLAERVCGICSISHPSTYARAVEIASGIEVPARADYIRTIMCELERIHSHTLWAGLLAHEIGFHSVLHFGMKVREHVMDMLEYVSGNRVNYAMYTFGGVRRDIPKEKHEKLLGAVKYYKDAYDKLYDVFLHDKTIAARTENVGVLSKRNALELCAVGPTARGSGIAKDVRADWPYAAYGDVGVKALTSLPVRGKIVGDVLDRTIVRLMEVKQSAEIIEHCLDQMPSGPIMSIPKIPVMLSKLKSVTGEGMGRQEAPRGELAHYVRFNKNEAMETWKVKAPTYNNLATIAPMIQNMQIADIPVVTSSIDPCIACLDRVALVGEGSKKMGKRPGTLSKYELHDLCIAKSKSLGKIEEGHH